MLCDSVVCGGCDAMVWSGVWCGVKGGKIWDGVGMIVWKYMVWGYEVV